MVRVVRVVRVGGTHIDPGVVGEFAFAEHEVFLLPLRPQSGRLLVHCSLRGTKHTYTCNNYTIV